MSRRYLLAAGCLATALVGAGAFAAGRSLGAPEELPRVYELRTYTTHPGRLDALNARFKNHTMRLFEKHGIENVMYWVPTDEKRKDNTLIYVVSHASEDAARKSWKAFIDDPEWHTARDASEADGKIVARVEAVYMTPTDYSPKVHSPKSAPPRGSAE